VLSENEPSLFQCPTRLAHSAACHAEALSELRLGRKLLPCAQTLLHDQVVNLFLNLSDDGASITRTEPGTGDWVKIQPFLHDFPDLTVPETLHAVADNDPCPVEPHPGPLVRTI
jgi:hypothetical protein